jgi:hypothetical protein
VLASLRQHTGAVPPAVAALSPRAVPMAALGGCLQHLQWLGVLEAVLPAAHFAEHRPAAADVDVGHMELEPGTVAALHLLQVYRVSHFAVLFIYNC